MGANNSSAKRRGSAERGPARSAGPPSAPRLSSDKAAESAWIAANEYCLLQYATGYTGGSPRRLVLGGSEVWIVSVVLTSPGYDTVGEVGVVADDAATLAVMGATPRAEVLAAAAALAREKRDELDAAFRRARTL